MHEVRASFDPARIMRSLEVAVTTPAQEAPAEEKRRLPLPIIARVALADATYMPEPADACMGNTFERPRFPLLDARLTREFMLNNRISDTNEAHERLAKIHSELDLPDTFEYQSALKGRKIRLFQLLVSGMWMVSLVPSEETASAYAQERSLIFDAFGINSQKTRPEVQSNLIVGATKYKERANAIARILIDHGPYSIELGPARVLRA